MPIQVSVTDQNVEVSTSGQTVNATVSGGVGPAGEPGTTTWAGITDKPATFAPASHAHGNLTNAGAIGSTSGLPVVTGAAGVLEAGAFGTTAGTVCQGNDARLTNARAPTAHAASHQLGGADAIFDQDLSTGGDVSFVSLTVTDAGTLLLQGDGITFSDSTNQTTAYTGKIGSVAGLPIVTGAAGVLQAGAFGTAAGQVCQGNDSRLSDARAPTAHTHAASDITSGTIAAARLGSGAASAATFLNGAGQWASVVSTSIDGGSATTTDGGVLDGGSATTV